jgi:signal transduction histidine kinase
MLHPRIAAVRLSGPILAPRSESEKNERSQAGISHRSAPPKTIAQCWLITSLLTAAVGYTDWLSGSEVSFSVFYLLPVGYATWFLGPRAGCLTSVACAIIWFSVEARFGRAYSEPWIPVWNASVRVVFFGLGVSAVAFARRTENRLLRDVEYGTARLVEEANHRQRLEHEMTELLAQEQVRIAQDLHDGLGQYLSALAFQTRILAEDLAQECSPHAIHAERMMALIRKTNQITRQLDRALRLPETGTGGLLPAVRALAMEFEQLTGVRCEVEADQNTIPLDDFRTMMLFRIVQEAFSNAVKHAKPSLIRASLMVIDQTLHVKVVDDGSPMQKHSAEDVGAGLRIMAIRAELIGARLRTAATGSAGFAVECAVPLPVGPSQQPELNPHG